MKIAIITTEYPPTVGGIAQSVRRIAKGLTSSGCEVYVIVLPSMELTHNAPSSDMTEHFLDGQVNIYRLTPALRKSIADRVYIDTACFEWLCDFSQKNDIHLLHCFYISHTGLITTLAAKECNIHVVASIRGNDLHKNLFQPGRLEYILWTLQHADLLTFVSADLETRAKYLYDFICPSRVIWNSVDPDDFDLNAKIPRKYLDLIKPIITCIGTFRSKKGIERLFDACKIINREMTIFLIGDFQKSEYDYWLNHLFPTLPPSMHLEVTGMVPHSSILAYLFLTDIVVFPSIHDACPNTLLESMLAQRPIICTNVGAMGEIVNESQGGVVIDAYSPDRLGIVIDDLLNNPKKRTTMGTRGKKFVLDNLSPRMEIEKWIDCYKSVLGYETR